MAGRPGGRCADSRAGSLPPRIPFAASGVDPQYIYGSFSTAAGNGFVLPEFVRGRKSGRLKSLAFLRWLRFVNVLPGKLEITCVSPTVSPCRRASAVRCCAAHCAGWRGFLRRWSCGSSRAVCDVRDDAHARATQASKRKKRSRYSRLRSWGGLVTRTFIGFVLQSAGRAATSTIALPLRILQTGKGA